MQYMLVLKVQELNDVANGTKLLQEMNKQMF